jgi:sugar phosphate isomerase/epimerase
MSAPQLLPSTTSHKHEPLLPTLEVFARLGWHDLDLNLGHLVEGGLDVEIVAQALAAHGQRVWVVSGGWCDFFHGAPEIEETFRSVDRQVQYARRLGADRLRLFYGRLGRESWSPGAFDVITHNLLRLADHYLDITFLFENHGLGASSDPDVCRMILSRVNRPNIRMNFDPINFEHAGIRSMDALDLLRPVIAHVHLKGTEGGECCEFGVGDLDLKPLLRSLLTGGYGGSFTVEYEGRHDRTVRLYTSVQRAAAALEWARGRR